jgi:hypothetical protein
VNFFARTHHHPSLCRLGSADVSARASCSAGVWWWSRRRWCPLPPLRCQFDPILSFQQSEQLCQDLQTPPRSVKSCRAEGLVSAQSATDDDAPRTPFVMEVNSDGPSTRTRASRSDLIDRRRSIQGEVGRGRGRKESDALSLISSRRRRWGFVLLVVTNFLSCERQTSTNVQKTQ